MYIKSFLALFVLINVVKGDVPQFNCDQGFNVGWMCNLEGIHLTKTNYTFKPVSNGDGQLIKSVYITNSSIPIFGNSICTEFPNTENIWLFNIEIEKLHWNAFQKCTNLKSVFINYNPALRKLEDDVFRFSTKLEIIDLSNNQLREINNHHFFYNTELKQLSLSNNLIHHFDYEMIQKSKGILSINIASNDLSDLKEEPFLETFPELRDINYNDNELNCARVLEINTAFTSSKITIRTVNAERYRMYPTTNVDNIKCLDDETWLAVYQRKRLTDN